MEPAETTATLRRQLQRWGAWAAGLAVLLNGGWLACMIFLAGYGETAAQVRAHLGLFRLSLAACVLLTLLQIPILLALAATIWPISPARSLVGAVTCAAYVPLNLVAYFSFGRLAPLVHADPGAGGAPLLAQLIEVGGPHALTGMLPFLEANRIEPPVRRKPTAGLESPAAAREGATR